MKLRDGEEKMSSLEQLERLETARLVISRGKWRNLYRNERSVRLTFKVPFFEVTEIQFTARGALKKGWEKLISNIHHYLSEIRLVILLSVRFFLWRNEIWGAEDQVGDWVFCSLVCFFLQCLYFIWTWTIFTGFTWSFSM